MRVSSNCNTAIGWLVGANFGYAQAVVNNLEDAHELIDTSISTALKESKPVYINISCNLPAIPHPTFSRQPVPFSLPPGLSNQMGLEAAVDAAAEFLNKTVKPVLVGGPKLRVAKACDAFLELSDACGYPLAVMPSAKGLVPEDHPHFIGTYWGAVSTAFCAEIVESADAYLFAGPIFNDLSCVGYSLLLKGEKAIIVQPDRVIIGNGPSFGCVLMKDFLKALSKRLQRNTTAYDNYHRIYVPEGQPLKCEPKAALRVNIAFQHIQKMLSSETAVITDAGDSWFDCQKLKLPKGCGFEFQLQYGSIGWSVGATLGYAQAVPNKRVIACIGDGSFQMTAQDVSTMLRCEQKSIIFLINNGGYTIEAAIHDGPYNVIKNWNYTGLVDAIHNGEGKCWTAKVHCEKELIEAIEEATGGKKDCLCFIEVIVHKDDTSKELLELGSRLSFVNSRPPNPRYSWA
ncbi:pyruvate decarboxylase 2-like [Pistacia vera]|uniref:pyruvate decarboxylase 2-like n=1 Tax=Pistacia vera TaxID=55513 RepID=UPI0012633E8F|nr:pyruvate decarboxylase 2-like [Pistacia vera]